MCCNRTGLYNSVLCFPAVSAIPPDPSYKQRTIILTIGLLFALAVIIAFLYLMFRLFLVRHPEPEECPALMEPPPPAPNFELDPLKMLSVIDRGRYGEVWQGMLGDMDVAVKVYHPQHKMVGEIGGWGFCYRSPSSISHHMSVRVSQGTDCWTVCSGFQETFQFHFVALCEGNPSVTWAFHLTHLSLVQHICVSELGQHWFRSWLAAWTVPSHHLNQCWNIVN